MNYEILVNDHIILKLSHEEDAEAFFNLTDKNREHLRPWLPWVDVTLSPEDTKKYLITCQEGFRDKKSADFGIIYNGVAVGRMGFHTINHTHKWAEVGYWLDAEYQGKGIMTESVKALMNWGFKEYNLHRIQIKCDSLNIKSKAIPERLGFVLEGTAREDHVHGDTFSDGLIFGILRKEFMF